MTELGQSWIGSPIEFQQCCDQLSSQIVVGFDTEFIGESTYHPQLCLIQISTAERLFAIDPFSVGPLDRIWDILTEPTRAVVVHAGREELRMCQKSCGRMPAGVFDTQIAAGLVGTGYPLGYANLVQQTLDAPITKAETLSDWSRRPLSPKQLAYAFDDVRYLLPLHGRLSKKLADSRRIKWMAEESESAKDQARLDRSDSERWRKLRGIGALDQKRLAIVRELYEWRDRAAERQNRPARTILRDDVMVDIARRPPRFERDLVHLRGVPLQDRPAIFEAVERGRHVPPERWPAMPEREIESPSINALAGILQAVLLDLGARWSIVPGMIATTSDVKRLVRARIENNPDLLASTEFASGWRAEHIVPVLDDVLSGRRSVRIGDLRGAAPLDWIGAGPPPVP
jgi:ribonuclease D